MRKLKRLFDETAAAGALDWSVDVPEGVTVSSISADEARAHLVRLIARFRQGAQAQGWTLVASNTPIQPLLVGESSAALQLAERLRERGVWVSAIRPPTVPVGTARLRITLCDAHGEDDVDRLLEALGPCPSNDQRGGAHAA